MMTMFGKQFWAGVGAAAVVAGALAGGYVLGQNGAAGDAGVQPAARGAQVVSPHASQGASSAPSVTAAGELPADHGPIPPRQFDQFRVGNRNVKAVETDGPITWIGTSGGVIRYDTRTDEHKVYDNKSGLLSNGVFHLHKSGKDLWVGTYGGGLSILDTETGTWRAYNIPHGMGDAFVYDVLEADNGDVWIATWSGANRIRGGDLDDVDAWELYTVENTGGALPNDWVYGVAQGANGDIWMATEGGIALYRDGAFRHWTHEDGLGAPYDVVKAQISLTEDPGQSSRHHAEQKKAQGLEDVSIAYNPNYVISIEVDDDNTVWAGTWGGGLSRFRDGEWTTLTAANGLPSNHIFMLERGPDGLLWIGTNRGLTRYDGTSFQTFTSRDGLISDNVFSMDTAEDGSTWIGVFGGVTRYRNGL